MRITHIFTTYFPDTQGGLEEAIRQISKSSIEEGFEVSVISLSKKPKEDLQDGVKTKSFYTSFDILSNPFSWSLVEAFLILFGIQILFTCIFPGQQLNF